MYITFYQLRDRETFLCVVLFTFVSKTGNGRVFDFEFTTDNKKRAVDFVASFFQPGPVNLKPLVINIRCQTSS